MVPKLERVMGLNRDFYYAINRKFRKSVKGPVKLIKRVKIPHSFLQSVSDQFHVIILSLPM